MPPPAFAVVDLETTHGDPTQGSIIEVAVLVHDGVREIERWNTLVQPRRDIPPFIQHLTGIRPEMLADAPAFPEVANRLRSSTQGRVMVAHNVRFDMTALQHEFARTGLSYHPDTLCTERLSRALVPHLSHYNLGSLCRYFGIPRGFEHCAAHDAQATLALLLQLIHDHGYERVITAIAPWTEQRRA